VIGLARSHGAARALGSRGVPVVRGDVLEREALRGGMRGCELVYHVAAINSHCPKDPQRLLRVNVGGTVNVVRAAAEAGVGRVVLTSSAASIGEPTGTIGTEDSPHRGSYLSLYEQSKHDSERVAFAIAADSGMQLIALNPSSVQGPPRATGTGAIIIAFLNRRLHAFVDTHVSVVDVGDVVDAHLLAAERGRPGQRYLLNGTTIPAREALQLLADLSGIRHHIPLIPHGVVRTVTTIAEWAYRVRGNAPPICRARVETILHGHRYDGSRAARELGLQYTPISETFRRTIAWAVAEGLVTRPLPHMPG